MRVTFNLTANDIRRGRTGSASSCPIARCIKRHLVKGDHYISVSDFDISFGEYSTRTPQKCRKVIGKVDTHRRKDIKPIQFTLYGIPKELVRSVVR